MADYTTFRAADVAEFLAGYGLALQVLEPIAGGSSSSNVLARCGNGVDVVVTVLDSHTLEQASVLAELTRWLIAHDVVTPPVLESAEGSAVATLYGRPCLVRPFVPGDQPARLSRDRCERVGEVLAELHRLDPPAHLVLPSRRLPDDWRELLGSATPAQLLHVLAEAQERFAALPSTPVRVLHGDLFPDNMVWSGPSLTLLDWECATVDRPTLDLAFTAVGLSGDAPLDRARLGALLAGYARGGLRGDPAGLDAALVYASAVLMFHRYYRHVVRFPDRRRADRWKGLLPFAASLTRSRPPTL